VRHGNNFFMVQMTKMLRLARKRTFLWTFLAGKSWPSVQNPRVISPYKNNQTKIPLPTSLYAALNQSSNKDKCFASALSLCGQHQRFCILLVNTPRTTYTPLVLRNDWSARLVAGNDPGDENETLHQQKYNWCILL
jgi:hypothetical protein